MLLGCVSVYCCNNQWCKLELEQSEDMATQEAMNAEDPVKEEEEEEEEEESWVEKVFQSPKFFLINLLYIAGTQGSFYTYFIGALFNA